MKRGAIYLILLTLWGCSSNPVVVPDEGTTTTLVLHAVQMNSAEQNSLLDEGTTVGIFVKEHNTVFSDAFCKNRKSTVSSDGSLNMADTIYLTENYSYDIYGYAPYTNFSGTSNEVEFTHGTDVLWCPKVTLTNVTQGNRTVCLNLEHRMAQISFNVDFSKDYNGTKLFSKESEISVTGFPSQGTLNVETGDITSKGGFEASLGAKAHEDEKGNMVLTMPKSCFIPGSELMRLVVIVHHSNLVYKAEIEDLFRPGTSYEYEVTIAQAAKLGVAGQAVDWEQVKDTLTVE